VLYAQAAGVGEAKRKKRKLFAPPVGRQTRFFQAENIELSKFRQIVCF
jgi:hypothetical protein